MKKIACAFLLACVPLLGHAQLTEGGIQFSGVLSANVVDDFIANNAYSDNNGGLTYLQLNGSYKDGPFGLESQLQFGPAPAGSGISPFLFHYGYGYLNLLNNAVFFAVGRIADLSTFGLNSFYQQAPNGVGVYGSAVGKTGLSGFGIDGIELKLTPVENLILGILMPYNINGFPIVNSTLKATRFMLSYTFPKAVQIVLGYQEHAIGVADSVVPPDPIVDTNTLVGKNKAYALANVLVSEDLTAGGRWELDHDLAAGRIVSNNAYVTLGGKIGSFSLGADAGVFLPSSGSAGFEVLAATSYTFSAVLPSVDIQPYVQAGFFSSGYPLVTDLPGGVYTDGFMDNTFVSVYPQIKLLLGKSQHELDLGYTLAYNLDRSQLVVSQLNLMLQMYF